MGRQLDSWTCKLNITIKKKREDNQTEYQPIEIEIFVGKSRRKCIWERIPINCNMFLSWQRKKQKRLISWRSCYDLIEQNKSFDIEQQPPFGDSKYNNTLSQKRGYKTNRNIILFRKSMKRCTRRTFRKIIPHQGCYYFYKNTNNCHSKIITL